MGGNSAVFFTPDLSATVVACDGLLGLEVAIHLPRHAANGHEGRLTPASIETEGRPRWGYGG